MISRLTWRSSGRNLPHRVVEAQPPFIDELEDRGGHEGLRDAADDHRAVGRQQAAPVALDAAAAGPHDLAVAHDGERRAVGAGADAGRVKCGLELGEALALAVGRDRKAVGDATGRDGGTSGSTSGRAADDR